MNKINFCPSCGKRATSVGIHTCSPQSAVTANDKLRARVAELEAQLTEKDKLLLLVKNTLSEVETELWAHCDGNGPESAWDADTCNVAAIAKKLAVVITTINSSNAVEGLILCDAEPVSEVEHEDGWDSNWCRAKLNSAGMKLPHGTNLYAPLRAEK